MAARVCSDHFEDVVIIDPDNDQLTASATQLLPTSVEGKADPELGHHTRSRVMQAHVIHATQGTILSNHMYL